MSTVGARLNALLKEAGLEPVDSETTGRFEVYYSLFVRWNKRLNLSSIRDELGILSLHFVESIVVARHLPRGITSLLDLGSGAGLPGIPIALCRPEIAVTLAESQGKKAAFLQEAVRALGTRVEVVAGRAEALTRTFDCVALRAVNKMSKAVAEAVELVEPSGWIALMTTAAELEQLKAAAGAQIEWVERVQLPASESRILALGRRANSRA
ncbi:MAG: 16S rRNA (guanine(527)-N(7))-methyltransferase RsmG [Terracidiphilus sp.]